MHKIINTSIELKALLLFLDIITELSDRLDNHSSSTLDTSLLKFLESLKNKTGNDQNDDIEKLCREKGVPEYISAIHYDTDEYWKLLNALTYRITRRNIVQNAVYVVEKFIHSFTESISNVSTLYCHLAWKNILLGNINLPQGHSTLEKLHIDSQNINDYIEDAILKIKNPVY